MYAAAKNNERPIAAIGACLSVVCAAALTVTAPTKHGPTVSAVTIGTCVAALTVKAAKSVGKVYRSNQSIGYRLSG